MCIRDRWYPPADTGMAGSRNNWCFLDFLSYIPNCIGAVSYTHLDVYKRQVVAIVGAISVYSAMSASVMVA